MGARSSCPRATARYAVDGNDDGKRDLWTDWDDVIASVANYFREYGWEAGGPVLAEPSSIPSRRSPIEPRNLKLNETVASLDAQGVQVRSRCRPADTPAMLSRPSSSDGPPTASASSNFEVITRYNRSARYAMAVTTSPRRSPARAQLAPRAAGRGGRRHRRAQPRGCALADRAGAAACSSRRCSITPAPRTAAAPAAASMQPVPAPSTTSGAPPTDINSIPDAVPKCEPRSAHGNPPFYTVLGQALRSAAPSAEGYVERGVASWYGPTFHGGSTSIGEPYDMYGMTAAHKTLPLPAYARVTNLRNGKSVVVRINDRGPFVANRLIDLSYTAAAKLDMLREGTTLVEVRMLSRRAATTS